MSLTPRQRIELNAALSMIALHGHNPRTVQEAAKAQIARGISHVDAYSNALEGFAKQVPGIRETLATIIELVAHSDAPTLAKYDAAISQFNQTGDNSALTALEPMIVDDFKSLIVAKGLATPEDAASLDWGITDALAFSDDAVAAEPWTPTPAEIAAPAGQTDTPQEGNTMNSREYAEAVRQLRANLKGRPIDDSPEYAALQAQYTGRPAPSAGPAPVIQNGQAVIPGHWTATGYRATQTGERARSYAGNPIGETPA